MSVEALNNQAINTVGLGAVHSRDIKESKKNRSAKPARAARKITRHELRDGGGKEEEKVEKRLMAVEEMAW